METTTQDPRPGGDGEAPPAPRRRRPTRRAVLAALGLGVLGLGAWSVFVEPRRLEVTRRRIPVADLPPALDPLRVVHLSDVHHGSWTPLGFLQEVVAQANDLRPDLVALTGDYEYGSLDRVEPAAAVLGDLRPRIASLAVLGNHDGWVGEGAVRAALAAHGIRTLVNDRVFVTPERTLADRADPGLCVGGVADLWTGRPDWQRTLEGVPPGVPRVVLCHNPDAVEEPALVGSGLRVDLLLAGHTHGGQVRLPLLGTPVVPSRYGSKYVEGLVQGPTTRVYVSRGIGTAPLPVRFGVRPEVALLELFRAP